MAGYYINIRKNYIIHTLSRYDKSPDKLSVSCFLPIDHLENFEKPLRYSTLNVFETLHQEYGLYPL